MTFFFVLCYSSGSFPGRSSFTLSPSFSNNLRHFVLWCHLPLFPSVDHPKSLLGSFLRTWPISAQLLLLTSLLTFFSVCDLQYLFIRRLLMPSYLEDSLGIFYLERVVSVSSPLVNFPVSDPYSSTDRTKLLDKVALVLLLMFVASITLESFLNAALAS